MSWWHRITDGNPVFDSRILVRPEGCPLDGAVQLCLVVGMSPNEIMELCCTESDQEETREALARAVSPWPREGGAG